MVVWVAAGGRGTLIGAVVGAIGVNWIQSLLTTSYPDVWLLFLGALFMGVVLFFPDGVVGALQHALARLRRRRESPSPAPTIGARSGTTTVGPTAAIADGRHSINRRAGRQPARTSNRPPTRRGDLAGPLQ